MNKWNIRMLLVVYPQVCTSYLPNGNKLTVRIHHIIHVQTYTEFDHRPPL